MFRLITFVALVTLALGAKLPLRTHGKIVGGTQVDITDYPHQVALIYHDIQACGGSIISEKFVVTAAHCTDGHNPSYLQIRAGSSYAHDELVVRQVEKVFQHPQYIYSEDDYDVSVLQLDESLPFSESIQPIALAEVLPEPGTDAVTSGWGALSEGGWSSDVLQAVTVPIVTQQECRKAYGQDVITDRMICAGFPEGEKDACQGDSGGPLVVNNKLVGIVSWSLGCARPGYPGVYSSVVGLRQFIVENMG